MGGRKVTAPAAQAQTTQHHLRKQQTATTTKRKTYNCGYTLAKLLGLQNRDQFNWLKKRPVLYKVTKSDQLNKSTKKDQLTGLTKRD